MKLFGARSVGEFSKRIDETFGPGAMDVFRVELLAFWNRESIFLSETSFRAFDGREISATITMRIPDSLESARNVSVSIVDTTERVSIENQLRHAQKTEAIGQLTAGLAHDLNNALAIIMTNFGLASRRFAADDKTRRFVDAAMKGIDRASGLTRKLQDYSRNDVTETRLVVVNGFISDLEGLVAKSLTPSITLKMGLADNTWTVDIDPGDLESTLVNLALNARDAMPDGGILFIETANKVIDEVYAKRNPESSTGEFVMISVSDTGTGMNAETARKAFDPFFTTKGIGKGTGLGLSMVHGFVRRSGGHIKIYTEEGAGTTIRLYLPRAASPAEDITEPLVKLDELPVGDETVLVVDDEEDLLEAAANILESLGYRTLSATCGQEALKVLKDNGSIDLLFSDVIMPSGIDGYDLAEEAKNLRPDLKVLLTSGFTIKREAYINGKAKLASDLAKAMLPKPYNDVELAIAVRTAIDRGDSAKT